MVAEADLEDGVGSEAGEKIIRRPVGFFGAEKELAVGTDQDGGDGVEVEVFARDGDDAELAEEVGDGGFL